MAPREARWTALFSHSPLPLCDDRALTGFPSGWNAAYQRSDHLEQGVEIHRFAEYTVGTANAFMSTEVGLAIILQQLIVSGDDHQRQITPAFAPAHRD